MGCAKWKKGAHYSGEMSRAEKLFGDEAMGYTAPVAKGAALGYAEQVGGVSDLLGFRADMGADSLEDQRYVMRGGGGIPGAPMKAPNPNPGLTASNPQRLWGTAANLRKIGADENAIVVKHVGEINWGEGPYGVPKTPQKGLGPGIGNLGMLPGEGPKAPGAPVKIRQPLFGGARRTKKSKNTRTSHKKRKAGSKARNTFRIRFTGQIRMKQRHRQ